jgi:pimeloyl-ACP methyl ester carboxylesterase
MFSMLVVSASIAALATGCVLLQVREQQQKAQNMARIWGSVRTEEPHAHPLVVVLVRVEGESGTIFDHFVVERAGRFYFVVTPGTYALAAFEDVSGDLVYEPDEPALPARDSERYELGPGDSVKDIELVIHPEGRAYVDGPVDISALQARNIHDQARASIGQLSIKGEVVGLDDPRFDAENGKLGLWKPFDFVFDVGPGIYFLEEYDDEKTPVLFVHGIGGYPREFEALVEGLDRGRFQPWVYYYPSGAHLDRIADHLAQLVVELRHVHGFDELFVVAHSMGGLVARAFILTHYDITHSDTVKLFVSISTPWGGQASAQKGVERSPVVVASWRDVAPASAFLKEIFYEDPETARVRRRLPEHAAFHLMFGYRRNGKLPGASGDRVIAAASALRLEAQNEAESIRGFDYDHTEILRSPEASARLNEILASALR